ncbi:MAG: c-type cytochrome [Solirubrobacteraceae bacterium]
MSPNVVAISPPRPLSAVQTAAFRRGEDVIGRAGCLACHTIDQYGNNGPGPPLSHIGSMLSGRAIASSLRNPTAPMPSFAGLAQSDPKQFEDLVVFLSTLR